MSEVEEASGPFPYSRCPLCDEDSLHFEESWVTGSEPHLIEPGPFVAVCRNPRCEFEDEI